MTSHIPPLPVCGLNTLGRGLMTAARTAKCARALGATVHSRNDCARDHLAITRPGVTDGSRCRSRDRRRSHDHSPLSSDRSRSGKRSWRPGRGCRDRGEAVVASRDRGNSGSTVEPAPAVAGDSIPLSTSSFPDLVRLFLSLLGPLTQWDATIGSLFSAAGVIGAGVLLRPTAPMTSAASVACSFASVPAPGVVTPASAASVVTFPVDVSVLGSLPAQRGATPRLIGSGPVRV